MADLRWTRDNVFADHSRGFVARDGAGVYDVPEDAVEDYLEHSGWESAEDDGEQQADTEAQDTSDSEDDDAAADPDDAPFDPGEYTVDELGDKLDSGSYDDAELDALRAAEDDGKGRATAVGTINGARE